MNKANILIIALILTILISSCSDDGSVNHFLWLPDNQINKDEFNIIICDYGTFYTGIVDLKPKIPIYCIKGLKDGIETSLNNIPIIIELNHSLSIEQIIKLRNNFKLNFLKEGYIRLEINNGIFSINVEKTGENLNDYIEKMFAN
jgi:hypothetical protein